MIHRLRSITRAQLLILALATMACSDRSVDLVAPVEFTGDSVRVSASVRWNQRAVALVVARQPTANGQTAVSRILTYLSLAQYRAVTAALAATGGTKPSISAAVGGASAVVLNWFFPLDVASTEAQLNGDLAIPPWPTTRNENVAAGESLGRAIGAAAVAQAASDNYLVVNPGAPPVGPDKWLVAPTAGMIRSLHGARPFFLSSASQLRSPAPPAVGTPAFVAALAEVRKIADTRTPAQVATSILWNTSSGPFTAGTLNLIVDDLIRERRSSEQEAARILAYANAAAFDAQIACWDTKVAYWYPRPTHIDPAITMSIALPNHPSYLSGHSCITAALLGVAIEAFPQERARLEAIVDDAGMSRVYGGIHYRFDIDAGRDIGRGAAALALKSPLK